MNLLVGSIFVASLLGSVHCVGMCGPFVAIAVGGRSQSIRGNAGVQAAYHAGRLITYVTLGTLAGAVGSLFDLAAGLAGVKPLAAITAGLTMIGFGGIALARQAGVHFGCGRAPRFLQPPLRAAHAAAQSLGPIARATVIGLLTTLLPCGWLWLFVVSAAGTARPELGALTMLVFWLGTLPMLIVIGTGVQSILGPASRRLPGITSLMLVIVGIYTVATRASIDTLRITSPTHAPSHATPLPCCKE